MTKTKKNSGFTLIEMIIVVAIIGLLSTLLLISVSGIRKNSIDTRRKANLENVRGAVNMYYSVKSSWPALSGGNDGDKWDNLINTLATSGYLTDNISADEDNDGVDDYFAKNCVSDCQIELSATCVLTTNEDCDNGQYRLPIK